MKTILVLIRTPFEIAILLSYLIIGTAYAIFGVRIVPGGAEVHLAERIMGGILLIAVIACLIGKFWRGKSKITGTIIARWGYTVFGIAQLIIAIDNLTYGKSGIFAACISLVYAWVGFVYAYRLNEVIKYHSLTNRQ